MFTFVVSKPASRRVENQLDSRAKPASQQKRADIRSKAVKTGKKTVGKKSSPGTNSETILTFSVLNISSHILIFVFWKIKEIQTQIKNAFFAYHFSK